MRQKTILGSCLFLIGVALTALRAHDRANTIPRLHNANTITCG